METPEIRAGIAFEKTVPVLPELPHPYWTRQRVADALGGGPGGDIPFGGISTDTRTIRRGDLFVALRGERYDAHDFLREGRDAGAAAFVVSDPCAAVGLGLPVYVVQDTLQALGVLGNIWRRAWGRSVIAVAGSNGKTSTKDLLEAVLGETFEVHATKANMNNLVGVPLTLLSIPGSSEMAVIEVGTSSPGEIRALRTLVQPDIAVLTSIGEEHLEGLTDLNGVLSEECDVFDGVTLAVVPAIYAKAVALARTKARAVLTTALDPMTEGADIVPDEWHLDGEGRIVMTVRGSSGVVPLRGRHQGENAMLAFAVAEACGASPSDSMRGLANTREAAMRGSREKIGDLLVVNDTYNANPPSMLAALDALDAIDAGSGGDRRQKVAVLGTMRELGGAAAALHDSIARRALDSTADIIVAVGEFTNAFDRLSPESDRVRMAADTDEAIIELLSVLRRDAIVLLKGSRGVRLEAMIPAMRAWAES